MAPEKGVSCLLRLTVTEVCVVAAAVTVLGALRVAVALVLRVVLLTTPAFTRSGTGWEKNTDTLTADREQSGESKECSSPLQSSS